MGWLRGLKLKLLIILLIGSVALEASLFVAFDIRDKQARVVNDLISMRIPAAQSIGVATTQLNGIMRSIASVLLTENDSSARLKRIVATETAHKDFNEHLRKMRSIGLMPKSQELLDDVIKRSEALARIFHQSRVI